MVPKHNGSIVKAGNQLAGVFSENRSGTNRLSELVRRIVVDAWSLEFDEDEETRVVGMAAGYKVETNVTIFARPKSGDVDNED